MTSLSKIDREVAELERQKAELEKRRKAAVKRKMIKCEGSVLGRGCGRKTQIGKLIYIDFNWYEQPWGCTGGAQWHSGEGHFICPKCGRLNRMYNREEWQKLSWYFQERTSVYNEFEQYDSQMEAVIFVLENQKMSPEFWKRWEASGGDLRMISGRLANHMEHRRWGKKYELPLKEPGKRKSLGEIIQEEFGPKKNGKK